MHFHFFLMLMHASCGAGMSTTIGLNKRGDRRGMNGRTSIRCSGGKFTKSSSQFVPLPPSPQFVPLSQVNDPDLLFADDHSAARHACPLSTFLTEDNLSNIVNGFFNDADELGPHGFITDPLSPQPPSRHTPPPQTRADEVVCPNSRSPAECPQKRARDAMRNSLRTPTPPPPPPPLPPLPLPPTENMQKFDDVVNMSDDVLRQYDVLYPAGKRVSKKKYMDWLIYQVGKDRRDLGTIPYIVTIDIEFPMNGFHKYDHQTGVHIANVVKNDMDTMMQIGKIFRDRHLFSPQATTAMIDHDMKFVLNVEPFHAISATRGGRVVGGAVFRCHLLNTGERVIVLEMIATDKTAGRGVGTALFRALRNLSQLSVAHNGHIAAGCLQTLESVRFYDRKLPERNGCMARAIMVSLAMLDDTVLLSKHLDLRYATVFASA